MKTSGYTGLILGLFLGICGFSLQTQAKAPVNSIKDIDALHLEGGASLGTHAPKGWKLDEAGAGRVGLCAMYVLSKSNFDTSPAIIYPRIVTGAAPGEKGIEAAVKESADKYKALSPKFRLEPKADYKNKKGLIFQLRDFLDGPSPNNFETVAYFLFKDKIFIAVYSAKTKKEFDTHKKSFEDFLDRVAPYDTDMGILSGKCLYPKK